MDAPPDENAFEIGAAFRHSRFFFTTGLRAGEIAEIRSQRAETLLTYRSFANIVAVVAAMVAAIVSLAGLAGTGLLFAEHAPLRAFTALALTVAFAWMIMRLVPRTRVSLFDGTTQAMSIVQLTLFPTSRFEVLSGEGQPVGQLTRGLLGRLGRNRWRILQEGRLVGEAYEESLSGAIARKVAGKFSRRWETDVRIEHGGMEAGLIHRRPDEAGQIDYLELMDETLDPRLSVALATILLGSQT